MIKTKTVQIEETKVVSKQCDICKDNYDIEKDIFECQEFLHIRFTGGYGSNFGDGTSVECDICQRCLHAMIKDNIRTKELYE